MRSALGMMLLVAALTVANAQSNPIQLTTEIYIVNSTTLEDGTVEETFVSATTALPNDVVEYRVFATNTGDRRLPAGRVQVIGPVMPGMNYLAGSATPTTAGLLTEYSVDGKTFSSMTTGSPAAIRWTVLTAVEPGQREEFVYRVQLDGPAVPAASMGGFEIVSFSYRWEGETMWVVGEIRNSSGISQGVELQAIARDSTGRLVDSVNFWPASVSNIPPGSSYGFRYPVTRQSTAAMVEVQIVSTYEW